MRAMHLALPTIDSYELFRLVFHFDSEHAGRNQYECKNFRRNKLSPTDSRGRGNFAFRIAEMTCRFQLLSSRTVAKNRELFSVT